MALKAGYKGIKKFIADKLNCMNPDDSFATDAEIAATAQQIYTDIGVLGASNFFDSNIYTSVTLAIDVANMKYATGSANIGYAKVEPNRKYKISRKTAGTQFRVATSVDIPDINVPIITTFANHTNTEIEVNVGETDVYIGIYTESVSALQDFKICLATDTNPTFPPYAQTNRELTVTKADISALGTQEGAIASRLYHSGERFYKGGKFCTVIGSADVAAGTTWTLNTNYVEGTVADILAVNAGVATTTNIDVTVDTTVNKVYQQGSIVNVEVKFILSADISASTVILTLPFTPKQRVHLSLANSDYTITRCVEMTTSKNVVSNSLPAGTYTIFGSYFI